MACPEELDEADGDALRRPRPCFWGFVSNEWSKFANKQFYADFQTSPSMTSNYVQDLFLQALSTADAGPHIFVVW
jgi:hypothetical protein